MQTRIVYLMIALALLALGACQHKVQTETIVRPDGSLEKVIRLETKDTVTNIFGVGSKSGWNRTIHLDSMSSDSSKDRRWFVTYKKNFTSAEEANLELASANDTLLRINSRFEKKFRWFYTYLHYSETIHTANNMQLPPDDYLVAEDYAFIERLPAEGRPISRADSFYLAKLHDRIWDDYGLRAYFEEYMKMGMQLLADKPEAARWADTLAAHKESIFQVLQTKQDIEVDFLLHVMDSLGVPLSKEMKDQYAKRSHQLDSKVNFISNASEGKYQMAIHMPWDVVKTNADSIAGRSLFWSPPSIKFLLKDYTLQAESRKMNIWAMVTTLLLLMATVYLWMKRR